MSMPVSVVRPMTRRCRPCGPSSIRWMGPCPLWTPPAAWRSRRRWWPPAIEGSTMYGDEAVTDLYEPDRPAPPVVKDLRELLDRARQGDQDALPRLREVLD